MADWDRLREMRHDVVPPDFEGLARTARHRTRRARAAAGALAGLVLVGGSLGVASLGRGSDGRGEPAKDPTQPVTELPNGARDLPAKDDGADYATLASNRYRIALGDGLAFDVDVPDQSYAHDDGRFVASGPVVLKTELADDGFGVPADACTNHEILPVGPSTDDLVQALSSLEPFQVSTPKPVTLGGAEGTYLEARLPASYDTGKCQGGEVQLPGTPQTTVDGPSPYFGRWWVLDLDGQRVMVQQACWDCTAADLDAVAWIPESITFAVVD